jgi:CBS domain-containing protein
VTGAGAPMPRYVIPDIVKRRTVIAVSPDVSVRMASKLMSDHQIGAVVIMENDRLVSIFTERDLAVRVVAKNLDPDITPVGDVATVHPDTLGPGAAPRDALKLMRSGNYRHLPVLEEGRVVGMVSMRDLYQTVMRNLEDDLISVAHRLIRG